MSIKYYHLAKDEELPEEFCAVRDVNGEPSEYTWYERMSEFERELWILFTQSDWFAGSGYRKLQAEADRLRELARDMHTLATDYGVYIRYPYCDAWDEKLAVVEEQMRELGIEV